MTEISFNFQMTPCPLCGSSRFTVMGKKAGGYNALRQEGKMARIVRCQDCRLLYANPMPLPAKNDLSDLYNEDYTKFMSEIPYRLLRSDHVDILEGRRRLSRLEAILGRKGCLLDIGCGPGNLLSVARERGWKAKGLEINDQSARFARDINGVDVVTGQIQEYAAAWADGFDAVHLNQVVEHMYAPVGFLNAVRQVIRSSGVLFCGVPNEDSLMKNIGHVYFKLQGSDFTPMLAPTFPPYHVLGFSPKTIRRMLELTGFTVVRTEHVNYGGLDLSAFRRGQIMRGFESILWMISKPFGHGYGLDVYAVPA